MKFFKIIILGLFVSLGCSSFPKNTAKAKVQWNPKYISYESISNFREGVAIVKKQGRLGLVNFQGNMVLPTDYTFIGKPSNGLRVACKNEGYGIRCGVLDSLYQIRIPFKYERISDFSEEKAIVKLGSKVSYLNLQGIVDSLYDNGRSFYHGAALVLKDTAWAVINEAFWPNTAYIYQNPDSFQSGYCRAEYQGKTGFLAPNGETVIPFEYEAGKSYGNGLFPVKKAGLWGYVNIENKEIIPFQYRFVSTFKEESALVRKDSLLGFINLQGNLIINFDFEQAGGLQNGLGRVKKEGKWGFINRTGKLHIPHSYEEAHQFNNGFAPAKQNGKWGLIDQNNRVVLDFVYEAVSDISREGHGWVLQNEKYKMFNLKK